MDTTTEEAEDTNTGNSSPTTIDFIDLTAESPRVGPTRSHRFSENTSASHRRSYFRYRNSRNPYRRIVPPIILGSRENIEPEFLTLYGTIYDFGSSDETVSLDDTAEEEDDDKNETDEHETTKHYTIQSDNEVSVPITCPICLEKLSSSLKPTTTRCGHIFCVKCLKKAVRTSKQCPTCKAAVTFKTCIRLYF